MEAGKVRESVQLFRRFDPTEPGNYHAFYPLYQLPLATEKDIEARGPWTVRVIGTTKDILHLWTAKTRWNGRIELSIAELIARTRENNPESRPVWRLH